MYMKIYTDWTVKWKTKSVKHTCLLKDYIMEAFKLHYELLKIWFVPENSGPIVYILIHLFVT